MLYVCPTPIGNLADVTFRVVEVLKRVDIIAAEDTRRTVRLLDHYGIRAELLSFHDFNETRRVEHLVTTLREGRDVAVVSDAGMPGLSDPGFPLLRRWAEEGIPRPVLPVLPPFPRRWWLLACQLTDSLSWASFPKVETRRSPPLPMRIVRVARLWLSSRPAAFSRLCRRSVRLGLTGGWPCVGSSPRFTRKCCGGRPRRWRRSWAPRSRERWCWSWEPPSPPSVSYPHLRAHETVLDLVCR